MNLLWRHIKAITQRLRKASHIMLALDFDGTLAPLRRHAHQARLSKRARILLKQLHEEPGLDVAILSGRSLSDIAAKIALPGLTYAGNHGLEIKGADFGFKHPQAKQAVQYLKKLFPSLKQTLRPFKGAWVENKGLTLTVHYRLSPRRFEPHIQRAVAACLKKTTQKIRIKKGKKIVDIVPNIAWHKGQALRWLMRRAPLTWNPQNSRLSSLPIYIGDDKTDEDAFKALGRQGISIFAGARRPSKAQYHAPNTKDVFLLLKLILKIWRQKTARQQAQHVSAPGKK